MLRVAALTQRRVVVAASRPLASRPFSITKTTVVTVKNDAIKPAGSSAGVAAAVPSVAPVARPSVRLAPARSVPVEEAESPLDSGSADVTLSLETGLGASLRHLLTGSQRVLLIDVKAYLARMRATLRSAAHLTREDARWLDLARQSSEELFLITVVGEFNAGKSNLLNSLLGGEHCPTGVLPTTEHINILRYGEKKETMRESENVVSVLLPLPFLKDTSFCDTPGTNAVLRSHELITSNFIPRADLLLFLTSVDRPFSESERLFLRNIARWRKKVCIVVNKVDLLKSESDRVKILDFVRSNAAAVLQDDRDVRIFPISADQALRAKLTLARVAADPRAVGAKEVAEEARALLAESGLPELETFIFSTLTPQQKIATKLHNPLGIGQRILSKYASRIESREEEWREVDRALLARLETQRREFETTLARDFELQDLKLQSLFDRVKADSDAFIEAKLRIANVAELMRGESLRRAYEESVYKNLPQEVETVFTTMFDYLDDTSATCLAQMQTAVRTRLAEMRAQRSAQSEGNAAAASSSSAHETELADSLAPTATPASVEHGSHGAFVALQKDSASLTSAHEQGSLVAAEARSAVVRTAVLEVGALSLGAAFALNTFCIASLAAIPAYFAVGGAVTLGLAGAYAIPYVRGRVARDMRSRADTHARSLRSLFQRTVDAQREQALRVLDQRVMRRYERYVREEGLDLAQAHAELDKLQLDLDALVTRVTDVTSIEINSDNDDDNTSAVDEERRIVAPVDQVTPVDVLEAAANTAATSPHKAKAA